MRKIRFIKDTAVCLKRVHSLLALGVVIETTARLSAEEPSINVVLQQRAGSVLGVPKVMVEDLADGEDGIKADKVSES
jgi:hypothetical protein